MLERFLGKSATILDQLQDSVNAYILMPKVPEKHEIDEGFCNESDYDDKALHAQKLMKATIINLKEHSSTNLQPNGDTESIQLKDFNDLADDEDEVNYSKLNHQKVLIEKHGGLANRAVIVYLILWYVFSALTLFTNKVIVASIKFDPTLQGAMQMSVTSICGFIQLYYKPFKNNSIFRSGSGNILYNYNFNHEHASFKAKLTSHFHFWRGMLIVGALRLFSIVLGLMALRQSAISFVETVKSSSPIFTVIISRIFIGEVTGFLTNLSLLPIVFGLALCSSFELNFSAFGFFAAVLTNLTECLQNVFSKLLLCGEKYKFTPLEVQFFTSFASVIVLVPASFFLVDFSQFYEVLSFRLVCISLLNALFFHAQSLFAFTLMSYISPVTHSVCNTLKRALLIWVSVFLFRNQVTTMSAFGTMVVIFGVLVYNHSRNIETSRLNRTKSDVSRKV